MEDKTFVWNPELVTKFLEARFENEWLFQKKKQPWKEFHKILLENGFPQEMTIDHVRKKWSYTYDMYKVSKKTKNKSWKYYKLFEKNLEISKALEKYASWSNEWRLKLICSISETKKSKMDFHTMWRMVEKSLRMEGLPEDCYIQDLKGLWHHIRMTFQRKHRSKLRNGTGGADDWPLYEPMLTYYQKFEPSYLSWIESDSPRKFINEKKKTDKQFQGFNNERKENYTEEFQWSKDITESFIQIRLQNDWLFRERKWAWNELKKIMAEEYDFPTVLTGRELCKKWASTYSEYQKAKATNNKSWVYYTLFELYLGEGSMNPIIDWQEEWVFNLISSRTDLRHLFRSTKDHIKGWREVEKKLRNIGMPIDHSLLDISEIWTYLLKTFKWKQKFAKQGLLNEQWPYYDAMSSYFELERQYNLEKKDHRVEVEVTPLEEDEYEDDMKLLDLKQLLQVKPERECAGQCRSCFNEPGCVNVFQEKDEDGVELAYKLKLIGGIQVNQSDSLPSQICLNCANQLENAYKFRRKCQEIDRQLRNTCVGEKIKVEHIAETNEGAGEVLHNRGTNNDLMDTCPNDYLMSIDKKPNVKQVRTNKQNAIRKKRTRKLIYRYWKVCEICGKHTSNLVAHLDMHTADKSYSCDLCDKKFKYKSGLLLHKSSHNTTPRKTCEVCGKTFHVMAQYRRHFAYHANERKFSCDVCGKRFNSMEILKVHHRIHTDERPFPCPECGKTFRTAGCVSRHKRIVHKSSKTK
ncbi:PREDICTED: uncharacterized protein LOC106126702 [Papilio xuthus]|uniref:Uncharacterized protein LOC106126702 n=1 Tax=Papilio xuthus TaxID=66420 RepID=A0AAJ6ZVP0_PAPXU|nr:PREDICTED: uncharacterized protein LOC106126702 [Papilio xuthus]